MGCYRQESAHRRLVPFSELRVIPLRAGKRLAADRSLEVAMSITYVRWRGRILGRKEYRLAFRFPVQIANASDRDPKYIPMVQALKPGWVSFSLGRLPWVSTGKPDTRFVRGSRNSSR